MRTNSLNATVKAAVLVAGLLLAGSVTAFGQQTINLTAAPTSTTLPDGSVLPMWGYFCGAVATNPAPAATCAALNPASLPPLATSPSWSPVVITVPYVSTGTSLTVNLTNNLSFLPTGATTPNNIPTSIVIVGQVGGGLGNVALRTTTAAPDHSASQGNNTWFIANTGSSGTPPVQGARVQSLAAEVEAVPSTAAATCSAPAAGGVTGCVTLNWPALRPGTYLLESGTHASVQVPMGLIGVLVVTTAPSGTTLGTAYPAVTGPPASSAVTYNAEVPLEFSEIDPVQNKEVDAAVRTVGFSESATMGPYFGTSVSHINVTNGGSGYLSQPSVLVSGGGGSGVTATAFVDTNPSSPTYQTVTSIVVNNGGTGFTSIPNVVISGGGGFASGASAVAQLALGTNSLGHCGEGLSAAAAACYPPVVNYTPFYYLINGVAFNKTKPSQSLFPATAGTAATGITGTVLVRMVNAGLRMHVPSIVGSQTAGFTGAGVATTATNPVNGFSLIAEDGNPIPGVAASGTGQGPAPRVQTDVFMAASKTFDVMINGPATATTVAAPIPVYDRELSLSANSSSRDAGMLAYIGVNGSVFSTGAGSPFGVAATANPDSYSSLVRSQPLAVSDVSKGVIANDINVYGVQLLTQATAGTVVLNANGTFTYTPLSTNTTAATDHFSYCANGSVTGTVCSSALTAQVTLSAAPLGSAPTAVNSAYTAQTSTWIRVPSPGVLLADSDPSGYPLTVNLATVAGLAKCSGTITSPPASACIIMDADGAFTAMSPAAGVRQFTYQAKNSQGTASNTATVTLTFPTPSNLVVNVVDAQSYNKCQGASACITGLPKMSDYRWVIEEDKTFYQDPACTTNASATAAGCPHLVGPTGQSTVPEFAVNFHTSHMEYVSQGCTGPKSCEAGQTVLNPATGTHVPAACDVGTGACDTTRPFWTPALPSQVHLDPTKRYYISVLPSDAGDPFATGNVGSGCTPTSTTNCPTVGHAMTGAPIPAACNVYVTGCTPTSTATFAAVEVLALPTPLPTGKLSVVVFEDDFPVNGEQDAGGGVDVVSPNEPGLGGFNLVLWDTYGTLGDVTGQDTYDMFNQPLSNALTGTIDPATGLDACPISAQATTDPTQAGITGMIVTCPKYEADGATLSPLAGQAVIANLMPDKFSVQAYPGADRIARGEEWLQTNTLDGQHPHDSFIRIGEPSYFQEYGPAGYHVSIGFVNPKIVNDRYAAVCAGGFGSVGSCTNTIQGQVDVQRMSRTPDQRLYPSGSRDALSWTQCWVSLGDPDAEDFMFTKCDAQGNFKFTNVPGGNWRLTIGDQWNDQIIDGLSTPANVGCVPVPPATSCTGGLSLLDLGKVGVQQWQANIYTRTFVDDNKNGIFDGNEIGIPFSLVAVRYRDGHIANQGITDFTGQNPFNETFPLFNWYVAEADTTRYKTTGTHTVYDAAGPADGSPDCGPSNGARACGTSTAYSFMTNTFEALPLPADLSVPGAVYCSAADCTAQSGSFASGIAVPSSSSASTGRIDPPWVWSEGVSALLTESTYLDFGKAPYAAGENGGIAGHVVYASTRPFDDASLLVQLPWEPLVPHVTVNLYQEGTAADGLTPTLKLVDTTTTSSWDDWAQGFYPNSTATPGTGQTSAQKPYMSCPGQGTATGTNADLFYYTLFDQPNFLDLYNSMHNGGTLHTLPYNSQFKCYDAMHIGTQIQPAPYDGRYAFPSSLGVNPTTGKSLGTNCKICVPNPDTTDAYRVGTPMLPAGKYVVEVVPPLGYEIEKEEDKNLLIGDNFIAPVNQQFPGLGGSIFIMPDQASVASLYDESGSGYNPTNAQNATVATGFAQQTQFDAQFIEQTWPCVGEQRIVPDYLSIFPQALEVAPYAGATRPMCDRKEVTLAPQMGATAKFYVFTSTHIAAMYTGVITDDFTSEFDPFAPQFGEKFGPPNQPVSTRDYLGNEISRVYSDHFGVYDGLTYSSWDVDPPNITGYSPAMMVQCMNDSGPIPDGAGGWKTDPLYDPAYSDFCYEEPYMPGVTTYLDTPVVPTQAFVGAGYNNTDCAYPDATPAIAEVDGDAVGPWVSAAGTTHSLTITGLGNQTINNYGYGGPSAGVAPFNSKTVTRHYGFGAQCTTATAGSATCNTVSSVKIGGVTAPITSWSDQLITVTVPTGVANCTIQQQAQYKPTGTTTAQCGQLVITAGNGRQSIDTVTVTIGGKAPTHISVTATIQGAIDAASPGDLIIVDPTCRTSLGASTTCTKVSATNIHTTGSHTEMLLMWKPVRLQGVGAFSSVINANTHPAGKLLDPWRRHINCLFGLTIDGVPNAGTFDPNGKYSCPDTGWTNFKAIPNNPQIDRLPLEATIGWDASLNGNLGELLQEPSLMGAYEGAGITVLAKGLEFHGQAPWGDAAELGAFPVGTSLLTGVASTPGGAPVTAPLITTTGGSFPVTTAGALRVSDANPLCHTVTYNTSGTTVRVTSLTNPYPSNFVCNPSSIDGLTVTNSSQGGGGIFIHGWAHYLQVANDRVYNNAGTLSGGISVGQGEFAGPYIQGGTTNAAPGSCASGTGFVTNQHLPMCLDVQPNVHHNYIVDNSSIGDELFSATLSGGGGASVCTGNDYYKFNFNWICGNLSAGEGGGLVQLGEAFNGDIEHNSFVFNQSSNPTIPTNGGGLQIQGTPDTDPTCGTVPDADCPPGLSDGTGPGLVINANLFQGNMADSGSGGGVRFQQVNGTEVSTFPNPVAGLGTGANCTSQYTSTGAFNCLWNVVAFTNNIVANNMAGWDGAGVSLQDSLLVNMVNNTIAHNDTLASSGVLTTSVGAPLASAPAGACTMTGPTGTDTASCPQSAGVTSAQNSTNLTTTFTTVTPICPAGHTGCALFSNPILANDVIWQNRSFYIGINNLGTGNLNQQKLVTLFDAGTTTLAPAQSSTPATTANGGGVIVTGGTGACSTGVTYWDLGVRGDRSPTTHESGLTLTPVYSFVSQTGYSGNNNSTSDPTVISEYCNGSRVPPECTAADGCAGLNGFGVPPGIADAVVPNPVFSLVPSATVDEGNNWINVSWGPLSLTNASLQGGANNNFGGGSPLGNYGLATGSPAVNYIPAGTLNFGVAAPTTDFYGNPRPDTTNTTGIDVGAVEQ